MKQRLLQAIARLASIAYQEAYMVGGTPDEYATPEDVVDGAASLCALALRAEFLPEFSANQRTAISDLSTDIRLYGPRIFGDPVSIDAATLVHDNPEWIAMRESAVKCLLAFGVVAAKLDAAAIDNPFSAPG